MPRGVSGVHAMRVKDKDMVFILRHRIPFVAWRAHRWNATKREEVLRRLRTQELNDHEYTVCTRFSTRLTGLVTLTDRVGRTYTAHHTDVMRI